jgi:hypothetical protein
MAVEALSKPEGTPFLGILRILDAVELWSSDILDTIDAASSAVL